MPRKGEEHGFETLSARSRRKGEVMAVTAKPLEIGSAVGATLARYRFRCSSSLARACRNVRVRLGWSLGGVGGDRVFAGAAASALACHLQDAADVVPAGELASRVRSASVFGYRWR